MKIDREKMKLFLKKALKIALIAHGVFFAVVFVLIAGISVFNPPVNSLMIYRKLVYNYKIRPVRYVPLKQVPKDLTAMLIRLEDCNFFRHFGLDPVAIRDAVNLNLKMKKRYAGGSTIDQQLARTLFLYPKKTYVRKYLEMLIALEMNLFMTKDRILELYLNSVEWGKGIFGIQNASYYYFNKGVTELDRDEMMRLVTILPSPVKYNPTNFMNMRIMSQRYLFLKAVDESNRVKMELAAGITNAPETNEETVPTETLLPAGSLPETNSVITPLSAD